MKRYSSEESIDSFFTHETDATRSACDALATSICGPSEPVPIQGACSYTLVATEPQQKIIQFRSLKEPFKNLELAREVHPEFVPAFELHGSLGNVKPVQVWLMDRIPGRTLVEHQVRDGPIKNTIRDLARFFAQAWNHPQALPEPEIDGVFEDVKAKLIELQTALPPRFGPVVQQALEDLPLLFDDFPMVLTHEDLTGTNIIVDPLTGNINGVIDWCASIMLFGFSLFQMYWIIGKVHPTGWEFNGDAGEMEDMFWAEFLRLVSVSPHQVHKIKRSRIIGLLLRTGYTWDASLNDFPAIDEGRGVTDLFSFHQLDGWLHHVHERDRL